MLLMKLLTWESFIQRVDKSGNTMSFLNHCHTSHQHNGYCQTCSKLKFHQLVCSLCTLIQLFQHELIAYFNYSLFLPREDARFPPQTNKCIVISNNCKPSIGLEITGKKMLATYLTLVAVGGTQQLGSLHATRREICHQSLQTVR